MTEPRSETQIADIIGIEILAIHKKSYGLGAESSNVMVSDSAVVVFIDGLELLPNERFMVDNGQHESVLNIRRQYQASISPSFIAAVERATGRTVANFFSETTLDPPFSVEIFRLAAATHGDVPGEETARRATSPAASPSE